MYFDELGTPLVVANLTGGFLLLAALVLSLVRILRGPTPFDRVIALDMIGGIVLCLIVFFGIYFDQPVLLDAAFAIALVSFLATVAFARYLGGGGGGDL